MQEFVLGGGAIDVVLAIMALEYCALFLARGRSGRVAADLFFALAPGALLALALRAALGGWGWMAIAGLVALSFPLHLVDLARRRL